jgi:hypothetical protein
MRNPSKTALRRVSAGSLPPLPPLPPEPFPQVTVRERWGERPGEYSPAPSAAPPGSGSRLERVGGLLAAALPVPVADSMSDPTAGEHLHLSSSATLALVVVGAVVIWWCWPTWARLAAAVAVAVYGRTHGWGTPTALSAAVALWVALWLIDSIRRPFAPCLLCRGRPRNRGRGGGRNYSKCGLCGGSGERRTLGAVLVRRGDR